MSPAKRQGPQVLFVLAFVIVYGLLHSVYFKIPDEFLHTFVYYHGIVAPGADIIRIAAPQEGVRGFENLLSSPRASLEVVRGCDGAGMVFLLIAAILAFSATLRRKLLGILGAVLLIYLLNLLRIVGLYFVAAYRQEWFLPLHVYFVPTFLIVVSCIYFAFWATGSARKADAAAPAD